MTKKNNQAAVTKLKTGILWRFGINLLRGRDEVKSGRLTGILWQFGIKNAARWAREEGARLIEGHLHANSSGGTCNWPLKGGAHLIEVAATAGGTVLSSLSNYIFSFKLYCRQFQIMLSVSNYIFISVNYVISF